MEEQAVFKGDPLNDWIPDIECGRYADQGVYYFVNQGSATNGLADEIDNVTDMADNIFTSGFLTKMLPTADFRSEEISEQEIQYMAENIQALFTYAYDGEGYILWERHPNND
ncbi:MAG TPA: hypothetical protein ENJ56_06960 [Anaerolineae bacterium]|nr:hypothetical protein [Anaerolineae bacterium]